MCELVVLPCEMCLLCGLTAEREYPTEQCPVRRALQHPPVRVTRNHPDWRDTEPEGDQDSATYWHSAE